MKLAIAVAAISIASTSAASAAVWSSYKVSSTISSRDIVQPSLNGFTGETTVAPGIWEVGQDFSITFAYSPTFGVPNGFNDPNPSVNWKFSSPGLSQVVNANYGDQDSGFLIDWDVTSQSITFRPRGLHAYTYDWLSGRYENSDSPGIVRGYSSVRDLINLPQPELYKFHWIVTLSFSPGTLDSGRPELIPLDRLNAVTASWDFFDQDTGARITLGLGDSSIEKVQGVPEPSTWALMIGGFGLAGAALCRRRSLAS